MSLQSASVPPGGRKKLGYVPALDGVRALAISLVVSYHAFAWPSGGFLGVHVFFVLSGFLITILLLQEHDSTGSISLRHFYRRRALRLLPALVVLLAAYVLLQAVRAILSPGVVDFSTVLKGTLYSAFYVSNVVQAANVVLPIPVSHLWSLATEEQFYLLWPFLLIGALRLGVSRRVLVASLAVAIAAIVVHRAHLTFAGASERRLYFAPDTTFDPILIGCIAGLWFHADRAARLGRRLSRRVVVPLAGIVTIAIAGLATIHADLFYWGLLFPFAAATAVLILAIVREEPRLLVLLLATPPLVFLGRISYSLYLWHEIVLWSGRRVLEIPAVLGVVVALGLATASYYLVELPFLRRKRRDRAEVERGQPARVARQWSL